MRFKDIIRLLPWAIVLILLVFLWLRRLGNLSKPEKTVIDNTLVLHKIEQMGKLELVRYNYKEVVEVENIAKRYLDLGYFYLPAGQDQRAVFIAQGEAVACIDLQKIKVEDIIATQDTIYIQLPQPEICYYKVNLENSKFYDLKTSNNDKRAAEFIDEVYATAEREIKKAALQSGILASAQQMAETIMKNFLENVSGTPVVLVFPEQPDAITFELD